ncbi:MAG: hypothetical protein LBH04_10425 [Tannerellaceae bacterium]|jgi:hypothetical protein|nr:hypothetical protein [Tannerellaceae bacterium]
MKLYQNAKKAFKDDCNGEAIRIKPKTNKFYKFITLCIPPVFGEFKKWRKRRL